MSENNEMVEEAKPRRTRKPAKAKETPVKAETSAAPTQEKKNGSEEESVVRKPKRAPRAKKSAEEKSAENAAHVEEITTAVAEELAQLAPKARKPRSKKAVEISLDAIEESKLEETAKKTARKAAKTATAKSSGRNAQKEEKNGKDTVNDLEFSGVETSAVRPENSAESGATQATRKRNSRKNPADKLSPSAARAQRNRETAGEKEKGENWQELSSPFSNAHPLFTGEEEQVTPAAVPALGMTALLFQEPDTSRVRTRTRSAASKDSSETAPEKIAHTPSLKESSQSHKDELPEEEKTQDAKDQISENSVEDTEETEPRKRRRGTRGRRKSGENQEESVSIEENLQELEEEEGTRRRRRRSRERAESVSDEVSAPRGSTRLEAKRQRRKEGREAGRRRHTISESEYLARRESVKREMLVREQDGLNQIAVLEDDILVEHYVARHTQVSMVGNVYLGRVQNVLPSMEAAFVDIGKGRNAVLYAGEVNWEAVGMEGQPRRIEQALKSGDAVLVQVTKDPIGHKGARLTAQITLAGRHLVLVPSGAMTGISRKLPERERQRLKKLLREIVPPEHGVIVRTAAEGATEEQLRADVERLTKSWEEIQSKVKNTKSAPTLLKGEPELAVRVVRDIFNEDFQALKVQGNGAWHTISEYVAELSPELTSRVTHWTDPSDIFSKHRVDEQLAKAFDRKVWLPSGGTLVIDRTEAMTVIDVNTGKFTGTGGTLEETVTRNNLEAAEEIVRQLRLRDIGGIIVVDFIDMVLEANRELVLRRLVECLGRDRTRHQVAEVTSLGLVQMTRKRVGQGLVEAFSTSCEACEGRGYITHTHPVERSDNGAEGVGRRKNKQQVVKEPEVLPSADDPKHEEVRAALSSIAAAAASKHEEAAADEAQASSKVKAKAKASKVARKVRERMQDEATEGESSLSLEIAHDQKEEEQATRETAFVLSDGEELNGSADESAFEEAKQSESKPFSKRGRSAREKAQEKIGAASSRKTSTAKVSTRGEKSQLRKKQTSEVSLSEAPQKVSLSPAKESKEEEVEGSSRKRRVSSSGVITPKSGGNPVILSFPAK